MNSKELIKEFFELTGRPISTMTVEEYLLFKNCHSKASIIEEPITKTQPSLATKQEIHEIPTTKKREETPKREDAPKKKDVLKMLQSVGH